MSLAVYCVYRDGIFMSKNKEGQTAIHNHVGDFTRRKWELQLNTALTSGNKGYPGLT